MKFGCVVKPSELDAISSSGFDYFEVNGKAIASMDDATFEQFRQSIEKCGLPCYGVNAYCPQDIVIAGPGANLSEGIAYAERLGRRLSHVGVKIVGIGAPLSRRLPPDYSLNDAEAQAVAFFRETGRVFAGYGILVCIEALAPVFCNFITDNQTAARLAAMVGLCNVLILVDYYSMELASQENEPFNSYFKWIKHVHMSDDDGSPYKRAFLNPEKAKTHRNRLKRLHDSGYCGNVTIETDICFDEERARQSLAILKS